MNEPHIVIQADSEGNGRAFIPATYGAKTTFIENSASDTGVEDKDPKDFSSSVWASWGSNNKYPNEVIAKSLPNGVFCRNLDTQVKMLCGGGIEYYKEVKKDGKVVEEYESIKEIDNFISDNDIEEKLMQFALDLSLIGNYFCTIVFNNTSSTFSKSVASNIVYLPFYCSRVTKDKKGRLPMLGYSTGFLENGDYDDNNGKKYPLFHTKDLAIIKKQIADTKMLGMHVKIPSFQPYYATPPHYGLFLKDSWLDVSNDTPKLISSLHRHLIQIKYHIQFSEGYWVFLYPEWGKYTWQKRKQIIDKKVEDMNAFFAGPEGKHKSWVTHFALDPVTQKPIPGVLIEPIKDYTKQDAYLPNSQAANAEICYAQGMDPSIIGLQTPGGSLGAGSGSDKRVAWNSKMALSLTEEKLLLKPLNLVKWYNGWDPNIKFRIKRTMVTTLDQNKSGSTSATDLKAAV